MKSIDIICPLYNAEKYIEFLHNSFLKQKNVTIQKIRYILTESTDQTEEFLFTHGIEYQKIRKEEYSHSLTREKAAFESTADILVFVTQDVVIEHDNWLYELTKDIDDENIVACYSKQISKYNNLEKYIRECNYPNQDKIKSNSDIKKMGIKAFFFSDASGAISTKVFKKLNGYDQKKLPFSEDLYIAYKIIKNGYKIKYCSNSIVYHSHKLTLRQIYKRYKLMGQFFKENPHMNQYGTNGAGFRLAMYTLKRVLQEFKLHLLIIYPFDMAARYLGMKAGER